MAIEEVRSVVYVCVYCQHKFGDPNLVRTFEDWLKWVWAHLEKVHSVVFTERAYVNDHVKAVYLTNTTKKDGNAERVGHR